MSGRDGAVRPSIRDFAPRDQLLVRRLILDGLGEHWGTVDESLNVDLEDIACSYTNGRTVVAELAGEVIGTGTLVRRDSTTGEIVRMSVSANCRRAGLGARIVEELIETGRSLSMTRVVLETSSSWIDVIAFYCACGFEVTGEQDGEFGRDTWFELRL